MVANKKHNKQPTPSLWILISYLLAFETSSLLDIGLGRACSRRRLLIKDWRSDWAAGWPASNGFDWQGGVGSGTDADVGFSHRGPSHYLNKALIFES